MRAILRGGRLPDDASIPMQLLYWLMTPLRLFRHRTAINLAVSYVAMALITITLLIFSMVAVLMWPRLGEIFNVEDIALDGRLGEQARAYALWLDPDLVAADLADGLDSGERVQLEQQLDRIVTGQVPGFERAEASATAFRVAHAAIISRTGRIVASDDPVWIAANAPITELTLDASRTVSARSLALDGEIDPAWGTLYSLDVSHERTATAYPLITDDGKVIAHLLLEGNPIRQVISGDSRSQLFRAYMSEYWRLLWLFALPAVIVAIPFGVWRSRSISLRLENLAGAADAMAEGALDTRVPVRQPDEIGRLSERFNEMAATIESNDRIRRAFISNVSHELRTPITIIQGTVERQLEQLETPTPEQVGALNVIKRESDMLGRMISDLFTLTRIDEQSLRLERRTMNVHDLASECVNSISALAWSQSRVSMESLVPPDLPLAYADPTRIRQVLSNLLYNSLRHTPEGGLVVIQAKTLGDMIELSVSDTGRGIPPEEVEHVFDRYYQGERGQRHEDGSGLGLSIVRQLVRLHGGDIAVESRAGEGTTFRFTLPQAL